jgi:hypothetical protein
LPPVQFSCADAWRGFESVQFAGSLVEGFRECVGSARRALELRSAGGRVPFGALRERRARSENQIDDAKQHQQSGQENDEHHPEQKLQHGFPLPISCGASAGFITGRTLRSIGVSLLLHQRDACGLISGRPVAGS